MEIDQERDGVGGFGDTGNCGTKWTKSIERYRYFFNEQTEPGERRALDDFKGLALTFRADLNYLTFLPISKMDQDFITI